MIIVTGAAGFIGSVLAAKLNQRGKTKLILVDHLNHEHKKKNLESKKYAKYHDKKEFIELIKKDKFKDDVECLFHLGACSSTTLQDADYYEQNNFQYTRYLAEWALQKNVRFIYASSAATYGGGEEGYSDDESKLETLKPLNLYGLSKHKFDLWARDHKHLEKIAGLKYFNVFGPNEYHKGDMRSVVSKAYQRVAEEGKMSLFKSYDSGYKDGEQKRDFIYVKDAVDMTIFFYDHPNVNGLYNVGTGYARTWNDLAKALFMAVGKRPNINYIEMPEVLRNKYQYFTQADMSKIRSAGYSKSPTKLEDAIFDYVEYLKAGKHI
jgi:ADP-L-glycero-D-manno-heptose 6-epimerase